MQLSHISYCSTQFHPDSSSRPDFPAPAPIVPFRMPCCSVRNPSALYLTGLPSSSYRFFFGCKMELQRCQSSRPCPDEALETFSRRQRSWATRWVSGGQPSLRALGVQENQAPWAAGRGAGALRLPQGGHPSQEEFAPCDHRQIQLHE